MLWETYWINEMKILDKIVADKKSEIDNLSSKIPISVLEDNILFSRKCISLKDIIEIRKFAEIPILRKEFIISEYQIFEAKSIGADAILLIASILTSKDILNFSSLAKSLGLEVLVEVHTYEELKKISGNDIDIIGVNNRNLDTLEIDLNNSIEMYKFMKSIDPMEEAYKFIKEVENEI